MKKLLFLFLLLFLIPLSLFGSVDKTVFCVCYQVGKIDHSLVLITSDIMITDNSNNKVKVFAKEIEKRVEGKFDPSSLPACYAYDTVKEAELSFHKKIKLALKRKFQIFQIKMNRLNE